jgi:hypothetical protein
MPRPGHVGKGILVATEQRRAACHETQDQEAVELGAELGYVVDVSIAQELLARELAARGCHEQAQDALRAARRLQERAEVAAAAVHIELVEAFCALCSGDLPRVIAVLEHRITLTAGASLAANIRSRWRLTWPRPRPGPKGRGARHRHAARRAASRLPGRRRARRGASSRCTARREPGGCRGRIPGGAPRARRRDRRVLGRPNPPRARPAAATRRRAPRGTRAAPLGGRRVSGDGPGPVGWPGGKRNGRDRQHGPPRTAARRSPRRRRALRYTSPAA